jgi:hypothetical protein
MSAAANAAGYLYAHDQLPKSDLNRQPDPRQPEPNVVPSQDQARPVKQARTPRIEFRKRRLYLLPSAA